MTVRVARRTAYVRSDFRVRAGVEDDDNGPPAFETDAGVTRKIAENADVRDAVGNPVVASDPDKIDAGRLTYTIDPDSADADSFSIDKATGQIRVAKELDHEAGSVGDSGADASTANDLVETLLLRKSLSRNGHGPVRRERQPRKRRQDCRGHHGHRRGRGPEREGRDDTTDPVLDA